MPHFTLTNEAKRALKVIGRSSENPWGREQRNRYLAMFDATFQQVAANPLKGKDCNDLKFGYRKGNVGSHVVYYHQVSSDAIEIVRLLHGRRNPTTRVSEPGTRE